MDFLFDPEFLARWLGIVVLDLSLAGDNALVIALAVRTLPPREQFYGRIGGTLGAVALRFAFIAIISKLLSLSFVEALGGIALIWIAIKLLRQESDAGEKKIRHGTTFWEAVWLIIVADLIMSLDNVLAVAAASRGNLILAIFGVGLSIPIVIWGAGLLAQLMTRHQWIVWIGGGVLGWVAGEMMMKDRIVHAWIEPWSGVLIWAVPAALAISLTSMGWRLARANQQPVEGAV
jgi:integral membrane protein, YjbE family